MIDTSSCGSSHIIQTADASSSSKSDANASSMSDFGLARYKGGWRCISCNYCSFNKSNVVTHLRKHTGIKPFQCPHCAHKCSDKSNLKKHIFTQHYAPSKCV